MSRHARVIDGVKLVESAPGAPLPPGVPANAVRCELVEMPDLSPAAKPWVVRLAAAGVTGGAATAAFLSFWGIPVVFLSLIALYHGLVPGTKTVVAPSPHGGYLALEADPDEVRREKPFTVEFFLLIAGVAVVTNALDDFVDRGEWVGIVLASVVGLALLYYGTRRNEWDASELAASLRFRAIADPARPLEDLQGVDRQTLQEPAGALADPRRPLDAASPVTTDGEAHSSSRSGRP